MTIKNYKFTHNGEDKTDVFRPFISSIGITDRIGLESDLLEFDLNNSGLVYTYEFFQGDEIEVELTDVNDKVFKSGTFYIDRIGGTIGKQDTMFIGCVSMPMDVGGLQTYVNYSKKRIQFDSFLREICKRGGLELVYNYRREDGTPWSFKLKNVSFMAETVGSIIDTYAKDFGAMVKVHDNKLIFSDRQAFDNDPVVAVIDPRSDSIERFGFELNFRQFSDYQVTYYNPRTGKVTKDKKSNKSTLITKNDRVRVFMSSINDDDMARALAKSVDGQWLFEVNFALLGNPDIVAGSVIEILEIENFSGKYLVQEVNHEVGETWTSQVHATALF